MRLLSHGEPQTVRDVLHPSAELTYVDEKFLRVRVLDKFLECSRTECNGEFNDQMTMYYFVTDCFGKL